MTTLRDAQRVQIDVDLPAALWEVTQSFDHSPIRDVYQAAADELNGSGVLDRLEPGCRVAVAVGSRGIANLAVIVRAMVDTLRRRGFDPFVTPAMGSHAGGTAEGQIELLAGMGVTQEAVGVSILASMEVKLIGQIPGGPRLYQDVVSASAGATFLINRVKPHTDFRGPLESGLAKMALIGLGKKTGATEMHDWGAAGFQKFLQPAARIYEANTNIIGGLALMEKAYDETAVIRALSMAEIGAQPEMDLLETARKQMGSLGLANIDVLVVRELGKNVSGTGMDTNIIGRLMIPREKEFGGQENIAAIAVLDLTPETHGNALGMGLANVTTLRVYEQIDWHAMYTNALTSGIFGMQRVHMPIVMPDDRMAIQAAVRGSGRSPAQARIVFVQNTLRVDHLW
ncbi:MAG TPA: hypothetical protein PJ988_10795, partial [Anaerolinea sp.]|nr:hypothetical protein [Anaerolinea sp.]